MFIDVFSHVSVDVGVHDSHDVEGFPISADFPDYIDAGVDIIVVVGEFG